MSTGRSFCNMRGHSLCSDHRSMHRRQPASPLTTPRPPAITRTSSTLVLAAVPPPLERCSGTSVPYVVCHTCILQTDFIRSQKFDLFCLKPRFTWTPVQIGESSHRVWCIGDYALPRRVHYCEFLAATKSPPLQSNWSRRPSTGWI